MKLIINMIALIFGMGILSPQSDYEKLKSTERKTNDPSFAMFLSYFPLVDAPYKIGFAEMEQFNEDISSKTLKIRTPLDDNGMIYTFLPDEGLGMFSRMGKIRNVYPVARTYVSQNRVGIIYATVSVNVLKMKQVMISKSSKNKASKNSWNDHDYQNLNFRMQIYDLDGNIISDEKSKYSMTMPTLLASRSIDHSCFGVLDIDGRVTRTKYKNEWKSDPYTTGLKGNEIVSFVKLDQDVVSVLSEDEKEVDLVGNIHMVSTP